MSLTGENHGGGGPDDLIDQRLVARTRAGEAGAWQELLARHQDRLYGVCVRMVGPTPRGRELATDLAQDAFVKIIQGLHTFDGQAKVSTWMIRVTMNVVLSWQRGQRLRQHASLDAPVAGHPGGAGGGPGSGSETRSHAELLPDREPTADRRVQSLELRATVAEALSQVEPEQRALLVLRDVRGLDYAQIAHVVGVPVGTIKSRLFRARINLREAFENLTKPSTTKPSTTKPDLTKPPANKP